MLGYDSSRQFATNVSAALSYPFETWRGTIGLLVVAGSTYVLLILAAMPAFTLQMLSDDIYWFDQVLVSLTEMLYRTDGWLGIAIIVLYALFTGVAVINAISQLWTLGFSGMTDLTGVLPGLLASGCASCGAGLLGFLGFTGGLAALPYDGTLLRIGGLALLVFFLGRAGHPEQCRFTSEGTS
ncbi:hypothetical protein [Halalkalicoccus salilacus]|uniref:hypothetical protein n=1 Tax=Halalkalicoccus salilacus TaxID=3117459 RepID=UPI0038D36A63